MKKRILMITTNPFYKEKGSSLRIYEIAKILAKNYKVDLVTYSLGKDVEIPNLNIYRTPQVYKPKVEVNKVSISKITLDILVLLKSIQLILKNHYQIIHCEDFEAAFIGRIILLVKSKIILVYDLQCLKHVAAFLLENIIHFYKFPTAVGKAVGKYGL